MASVKSEKFDSLQCYILISCLIGKVSYFSENDCYLLCNIFMIKNEFFNFALLREWILIIRPSNELWFLIELIILIRVYCWFHYDFPLDWILRSLFRVFIVESCKCKTILTNKHWLFKLELNFRLLWLKLFLPSSLRFRIFQAHFILTLIHYFIADCNSQTD
jgi:hypothetical protein